MENQVCSRAKRGVIFHAELVKLLWLRLCSFLPSASHRWPPCCSHSMVRSSSNHPFSGFFYGAKGSFHAVTDAVHTTSIHLQWLTLDTPWCNYKVWKGTGASAHVVQVWSRRAAASRGWLTTTKVLSYLFLLFSHHLLMVSCKALSVQPAIQ